MKHTFRTILLCALCLLLLAALCSCQLKRTRSAGKNEPTAPPEEMSFASVAPPQGMRLGPSYVSALGEACFEAYPEYGGTSQAQAYCRRDGQWTLLPDIFMHPPHSVAKSH